MFKVNIYIETDGGDKRNRYRTYAAIIEFMSKKSEPVTRDVHGTEKTTGYGINLLALNAALSILTKPCEATVYMDCPYVTEKIRYREIYKWYYSGWKTIQGKPIANQEEWKKIIWFMEKHELIFAQVNAHSYKDRLQYDIRKFKGQNWQQQKIAGR